MRSYKPAAQSLNAATVQQIRDGNIGLLKSTTELWPEARLMYRTLHAVKASPGGWFLAGLPLVDGKPFAQVDRDPFAANKVAQINEGIRALQALRDVPRFDIFDLGRVTQSYTADCKSRRVPLGTH